MRSRRCALEEHAVHIIDQKLQVAQALESFSQLQAFMILLIAPVNRNCRRTLNRIALKSSVPGVELEKEVGLLFYHREDFPGFKAIAGRGSGFWGWSKNDHFMVRACSLVHYLSLTFSPSATPGCRSHLPYCRRRPLPRILQVHSTHHNLVLYSPH